MGWQHGCQVRGLRPQIAGAIKARLGQLEQDGGGAHLETPLRETCELLQEIGAPLLDMIRGQAKALEFEFHTLLRYTLATFLQDLALRNPPDGESCTTWAATGPATANGQPILVKNRDCHREDLALQIVTHATPDSGYRYVYISSAGSPGVFCAGINQAGLAVADTYVCSTDLGPGLPAYVLMMHILEKQDNVFSAVDYLRSVPRMGRKNLILADAHGDQAVFEIGHRRYGLFGAHNDTVVNTNHFASPEMRNCFVDRNPPLTEGNSFHRHTKVTTELNAVLGKIDVSFAQRLMGTHDGPLTSICRHPGAGSNLTTISASIFLPAQRTMLFCHGLPCHGRYDSFVL